VSREEILGAAARERPKLPAPAAVPDFDGWVAAHGPGLVRFAYAVIGDQRLAEQTVQTCLARAYARWPRLNRTGDPASGLHRMVLDAHTSWWRRMRGRPGRGVAAMIDLPSAESRREQRSLSDLLWEWCQDLPTRQRAAIVLRLHDQLSYAQIGTSLGCTEEAARSHVHRGLVALRLALEDEEDRDD
jgi:RNA polymerase sigma factor (sigma-70 family)